MSVLWILVFCLVALVWVLTVVDFFRRHYSGWTLVGWLALIVFLPIVGSIIYWFARKPTREEAEQQYLAEADRRRSAGARPFDSTGWGRDDRGSPLMCPWNAYFGQPVLIESCSFAPSTVSSIRALTLVWR
jgi:hypothetical protein